MQIVTTARHCELDPALRQFVQQRLERLERFARDIREAHVIVTAEKFRHTAEITLHVGHRELVSREESTEAQIAVDRAADRLEAQLRRLKDRRIEHHPRAQGDGRPPEPAAEGGEGFEEE